MSAIAIIPARYASTRFPAKPLARATGKYLIQHVYERSCSAKTLARVLIATDDERILAAVREFGGAGVLTSPDHPSGTDRIAEVVRGLPPADSEIVLNVQGDEPEIDPAQLDRLVLRLRDDLTCDMATLACPFPPDADPRSPNSVKVVLNQRGVALYFSRSLIPYDRDAGGLSPATGCLLHLGVYAYRRACLLALSEWTPTRLERIEKLEQLRALEHGVAIAVEKVDSAAVGIDTPEDYERFVARYGATSVATPSTSRS